jgi:dTDP-4-dehydrorhamnose reductase
MRKILVTGSTGQLGSEITYLAKRKKSEDYFFFTDADTLDITDAEAVESFCKTNEITHIINAAAYTAVDKAESDEVSADKVNHKAVENLARIAKTHSISLIHISTDYVFDGRNYRPYKEDDPVAPQSVYGLTKLRGEEAMYAVDPAESCIVRTSWVYSSYGSNFVKTMLRLSQERKSLGVIFDQVGTPTYARDLAEAILHILPRLHSSRKVKTYHYSNEGVCSWYDFAKAIFELSDRDIYVDAIPTDAYPTPAKRPHYSVLDKTRIKKVFGVKVPYWRDSLKVCLKELGVYGEKR